MSLSGIQLVTGVTIEQPNLFSGKSTKQKVDGEPFAMGAFLVAIAGLFLSFLRGKKGLVSSIVLGGVGSILLLLLKMKLAREALASGAGVMQIDYKVGFYFSLFLFLTIIGLNCYFLFTKKRSFNISKIT